MRGLLDKEAEEDTCCWRGIWSAEAARGAKAANEKGRNREGRYILDCAINVLMTVKCSKS